MLMAHDWRVYEMNDVVLPLCFGNTLFSVSNTTTVERERALKNKK